MIPSGRFPPMSALFYFFSLCNRLIFFLNYGNYSEILHCLFLSFLFFSIVCKLTGGRKDSALAPGFLGTAAVEKKNIGLLIRVMAHLTTKFPPDKALGRVDKVTGWTKDRAKTIRERLARHVLGSSSHKGTELLYILFRPAFYTKSRSYLLFVPPDMDVLLHVLRDGVYHRLYFKSGPLVTTGLETPSKKSLISMDKFFYGAFITQFCAVLFLRILQFPDVEKCRPAEKQSRDVTKRISFKDYWDLCCHHWKVSRDESKGKYKPGTTDPVYSRSLVVQPQRLSVVPFLSPSLVIP